MTAATDNFGTAGVIYDEFIAGPVKDMRDDLEKEFNGKIRTCQLCTHQQVCVIWSLFKANIENKSPSVTTATGFYPIIDSDDLAKICRMYKEEIKP